jgi:hypothetical protein
VCRQVKNDPACQGAGCEGSSRCGTLDCPPIETPDRCQQIELCSPQSEFVSQLDPGSDLAAEPFDPAALFDGGAPVTTPSSDYQDPPEGQGKNHSWCFMDVQRPVAGAAQPSDNKHGSSGQGSPISFSFDPNLTFDANVNPLSLGETDLNIHAQASLLASVKLTNIFESGIDFGPVDILKAVADIRAERCTIRTTDTSFKVFEHEFIDQDSDFIFDTSEPDGDNDPDNDFADETQACNTALGDFITAANRAKKAFRDAQQLLKHYHDVRVLGENLGNLCQQVMALVGNGTDVPFFPGGLSCPPNEPPEITINRFLEYYQAPGFGQITQLRQAVQSFKRATERLQEALSVKTRYEIADPGRQESKTLLNVNFAIGPVPMVIQVDAFYAYGVSGGFEFELKYPFNPLQDERGKRNEIAKVKAGVMPYANAGLSAFVGAGTSYGKFSATAGIEGSVTLGNIKAPIFAGAGVGAEVTEDVRPFPQDIAPPVSVAPQLLGLERISHFNVPTAFKFFVWYDYGAAVDLKDVLKGEIDARLRIKFFFFSKTWRKRLLKYNGWSFHYPLVSGKLGTDPSVGVDAPKPIDPTEPDLGGATVQTVQGTTDMGLAEQEAPLAILAPLRVVEDPNPSAPVKPFDATALESVFYDNLCCSKPTERCPLPGERAAPGVVPCCPGTVCQADPDGTGVCVAECRQQGAACTTSSDCCPVPEPQFEVSCGAQNTCVSCGIPSLTNDGAPCTRDSDCCGWQDPANNVQCNAVTNRCAVFVP